MSIRRHKIKTIVTSFSHAMNSRPVLASAVIIGILHSCGELDDSATAPDKHLEWANRFRTSKAGARLLIRKVLQARFHVISLSIKGQLCSPNFLHPVLYSQALHMS